MRLFATRPRLYWTLQVGGWALYGIFGGILAGLFSETGFSLFLLQVEIVIMATLLLLSHLLRLYMRRNGWARLPLPALLPRLFVAHLAVAVGSQVIIGSVVVLILFLNKSLGGNGFPWMQYIGYAMNVFFVMWMWSALYFGLHYLEGYRQAEIDKWKLEAVARQAEMLTLKAQINPHFLFNGLNNIRALVLENPARARQMMTHLAELLRYSLQLNSLDKVPLARELDIVRDYLALEALQLEERLCCTLDIAPAALDALLPPMTLQLLVENAIKHGIAPRPDGGTVQVVAHLDHAGYLLCLTVRNTGHFRLEPIPAPGATGVGLPNARERLRLLFGPSARLHVADDPDQANTVRADVCLPLEWAHTPPAAHLFAPATHERIAG